MAQCRMCLTLIQGTIKLNEYTISLSLNTRLSKRYHHSNQFIRTFYNASNRKCATRTWSCLPWLLSQNSKRFLTLQRHTAVGMEMETEDILMSDSRLNDLDKLESNVRARNMTIDVRQLVI